MHADGVSVHRSDRLVSRFVAESSANIAQNQLIRRQRNRLTQRRRSKSFFQRARHRLGRLLRGRTENRLAHLINPRIIGLARPGRLAEQMMLLEHLGQQRPRRIPLATLIPRSEEHTSELQSQSNLVCRLLLEKKKKRDYPSIHFLINKSTNHTNVILRFCADK